MNCYSSPRASSFYPEYKPNIAAQAVAASPTPRVQSPALQQIQVTVPQGMRGGMPLQVQTPAGIMQVQIPPGLMPGQTFQMQVPAPQQQVQPMAPPMAQPMAQPAMAPQPVVVQQPQPLSAAAH